MRLKYILYFLLKASVDEKGKIRFFLTSENKICYLKKSSVLWFLNLVAVAISLFTLIVYVGIKIKFLFHVSSHICF